MIYAAIAAGGTGSRMGSSIPKQFLNLDGVPLLIHTIKAFEGYVDWLYVGVLELYAAETEELLKKYGLDNFVSVVIGGNNRMETLHNIVCKIEADHSVGNDDIILTHDAVRPFINSRIVYENIEKCRFYGACGTFVPAVDTIAVSVDGEMICDVPKRSTMFNTQTPQTAKLLLLKKVLDENVHCFEEFTDVCGMLTILGYNVAIVQGEYTNIKITTPSDLIVARGIMGE